MPERLEPANTAEWSQFGHQHLQRYRFALEHIEGPRVLDLACGVGYGSYVLSQSRGRDVTGIDLDPKAIAYGQDHYQNARLRLIQGDALKWENDGPPFDTIVSFETIEHLPDPVAFVARLASLVRTDGLLLISAPNTLQHKLAPDPVHNEFHLSEPDYATFHGWLSPHFSIEAEWEQSSVYPPGMESVPDLAHDTEVLQSHWWLRAANRIERVLRTMLGMRRPIAVRSKRPHLVVSTDIVPLLPERRPQCEVFIFVCRRRPAMG